MQPSSPRRLLAVLAHPDDESFGMGGTLALYARRGVEVYLICATRGEAGDVADLKGYASVGDLRQAELECAAKALGLKEVHFLGYRDSGMPGSPDNDHPQALIRVPLDEVAARIVAYMRRIRPQVVVTFDPIGGYRHPDHIHIHQATVLAFEHCADPDFYAQAGSPFQPLALYYHVFPRWFLRWMVFWMRLFGKDPRRWGKNGDIDLVSLAEVEFPTHVRINIRSVLKIKDQAGACHVSQGGEERRGLLDWLEYLIGGHEDFMRAYPPVNGSLQASDLFDV